MIDTPLLILGMAFLLMLAALVLWERTLAKRERIRLAQFGVDDTAIITKKISETGPKGAVSYFVNYKFDALGADGRVNSFTVEQRVARGMYQLLTEDMEVTIRYLPGKPTTTVELSGRYADSTAKTLFINGLTSIVVIVGFVVAIAFSLATTSPQTVKQNPIPTITLKQIMEDPDLVPIMTAVAPYRAEWEQVSDQTERHVTPAQVGLSSSLFTDLVYGTCSGGGFYLFVEKGLNPTHFDAYGYTTKPNEPCRPSNWAFSEKNDLGGGWLSATVVIRDAH